MRTNFIIFAFGALVAFVVAGWVHSWQLARLRHPYMQVADTVSVPVVQEAGLATAPVAVAEPEPAPVAAPEEATVPERTVAPISSRQRTGSMRRRVSAVTSHTQTETHPVQTPVQTAENRLPEPPPPPVNEEERHPLKQRPPATPEPAEQTAGATTEQIPYGTQQPAAAPVPAHRSDPVVRQRSAKMRAVIIGGSAAGGAVIGAIAGHGRGAAIGALVGAAGGYLYDHVTRHR